MARAVGARRTQRTAPCLTAPGRACRRRSGEDSVRTRESAPRYQQDRREAKCSGGDEPGGPRRGEALGCSALTVGNHLPSGEIPERTSPHRISPDETVGMSYASPQNSVTKPSNGAGLFFWRALRAASALRQVTHVLSGHRRGRTHRTPAIARASPSRVARRNYFYSTTFAVINRATSPAAHSIAEFAKH